jgi:A/G-specific adenine glycosylase
MVILMQQKTNTLQSFNIDSNKVELFITNLSTWYSQHKRILPWRETTDPYNILVSEMMLQQTQVSRVIPKYLAFLESFPTPSELANADLADVLKLWSGLGYNRRAKYLHNAAKYVVNELGGVFPNNVVELKKIPGIGDYTAGAICAFSFNLPAIVIDANVKKVINRVFGASLNQIPLILEQILQTKIMHPRDLYNAIMDVASEFYSRGANLENYPFTQICLWINGHEISQIKTYKQSKFKGSNRWYRGQILKLLATVPTHELSLSDIEELAESEKYVSAIEQLLHEKLILRDSTKIYMAK